jgi:HEAT repeat protein
MKRPPSSNIVRAAFSALLLCVLGVLCVEAAAAAQEPAAPQPTNAATLKAAIDKLGNLDYTIRTDASRTIRRATAAQTVPALLQTVSDHADGYVRYRALVLLTGFNDPRTKDAMRESLTSPNDRLRAVAYSYFEHNPDPALLPQFLTALEKEVGEFVRPELVRALAANGKDPKVQQALVREVGRGQDFFRSAVIEALGDYKAAYAYDALTAIAKLDGPLQDDAALALGKIGDKRALETLATLQRSAPRASQPLIAASICLLNTNCGAHTGYLIDTLKFTVESPGFQELARAAAAGLGAIATSGPDDAVRTRALDALFEIGIPAHDPVRPPVALAVGTVALRHVDLMLARLMRQADQRGAIALLGEAFDMLEEDFEKERFFMTVRRTYWGAPGDTPMRQLTQTLIGTLDF